MPSSDSQAFLRELDKSDDTSVVSEEATFAGKLIDLIATNPFLHAKVIFGQFALAEGKKGRAFLDAQVN